MPTTVSTYRPNTRHHSYSNTTILPLSQSPSHRTHNLQTSRIARIRQPVARRMPRHTCRRRARLHLAHILPRLHVRDLEAVALVAPAHHVAAVPAEADTAHTSHHGPQRAPAHPVRGVPERDERVGAARGEIATGGREGKRGARRRVRVEGVERREGRVGCDDDGAGAGG